MKIVFLDRKTLGYDVDLTQYEKYGTILFYDTTSPNQTLQHLNDAQIVVTNKVVIDKEIMDKSNIKLICVAATGMNNIDLEYAQHKGIIVKNVAGYSTSSVIQLTLSFVLKFVQKIDYYDDYGKNHWKDGDIFTNLEKPFFELDGKTWGIIGLGSIGKGVAKVAEAFGCKVQYHSTSGHNHTSQYQHQTLEELLKTSDILTIHAPLNPQTKDLINQHNIGQIKKGAILLNLGRGGIINERDISEALNSGQDLYFGTDVATVEPIEANSPLLQIKDQERLLITPHIAWASKEARVRLLDGIEKNIKEFLYETHLQS